MVDELLLRDERTIRVFSDPLRQRILSALEEKGPLTSSGLARVLGGDAARFHYHLGKLEGAGLVELDHEEVIHGIRARYLRPSARSYRVDRSALSLGAGTQASLVGLAQAHFDESLSLLKAAIRHRSAHPEAAPVADALLLAGTYELSPEEASAVANQLADVHKYCQQLSLARRQARLAAGGEAPVVWHVTVLSIPKW